MTTYDYRLVEVIRVVDGDTIDARIDLGLHLTAALRFRIADIDTPERGKPGWTEATEYTRAWLIAHTGIRMETHKADSFGRWLASIYDQRTGHVLSDDILQYMSTTHGIDCTYRP